MICRNRFNRYLFWILSVLGIVLLTTANGFSLELEKTFKKLGIIKLSGIKIPSDDPLTNLDGNIVRISDLKGKIVFLNFWTTWCPECVIEMPRIEKLYNKMPKDEFAIIALDLREPEDKVAAFVKRYKLSFPIWLDKKGKLGRSFGIRSIPTTFIIGRNGALLGRIPGSRNWMDKSFVRLFETLIKNETQTDRALPVNK